MKAVSPGNTVFLDIRLNFGGPLPVTISEPGPKAVNSSGHIASVDGLRAYLAWTVVITHIVWYTGADGLFPILTRVRLEGAYAVQVFIILSGFVLTHLIIGQHENYGRYIARRGFRIFPVYLICLAAGVVCSKLYSDTILTLPWGDLTPNVEEMRLDRASLAGTGFAAQLFAHVGLLQGLIPNQIAHGSQEIFLAPAWSLSLEWQFYLIAPFIVALALKPMGPLTLFIFATAGFLALEGGVFGDFDLPGNLAFGGPFLLLGILTRLCLSPPSQRSTLYASTALALIVFISAHHAKQTALLWSMFVAPLLIPWNWLNLKSVAAMVFEARPIRLLGKLSYSTYVVHVPIIQLLIFIAIGTFQFGQVATVIFVLLLALPLTLGAAYLLYVGIEAPMITYAKRSPLVSPRVVVTGTGI